MRPRIYSRGDFSWWLVHPCRLSFKLTLKMDLLCNIYTHDINSWYSDLLGFYKKGLLLKSWFLFSHFYFFTKVSNKCKADLMVSRYLNLWMPATPDALHACYQSHPWYSPRVLGTLLTTETEHYILKHIYISLLDSSVIQLWSSKRLGFLLSRIALNFEQDISCSNLQNIININIDAKVNNAYQL